MNFDGSNSQRPAGAQLAWTSSRTYGNPRIKYVSAHYLFGGRESRLVNVVIYPRAGRVAPPCNLPPVRARGTDGWRHASLL